MFNIDKGTIVAVIEFAYVAFPGGAWSSHFVKKKKYYMSMEFPTNNGNFHAKDSTGRQTILNELDVIETKEIHKCMN